MDNETKNILKILGVAIVVLFILKPKGKSKSKELDTSLESSSTTPPAEITDEMFENAKVSLNAYRNAINNGESEQELEKLNRITVKEYGIKVFKCKKSGKLTARSTSGQEIAKEQ